MDASSSVWPWIVEFVLLEPIDSEWADNVIGVIPPSRLSDSLLERRIKKSLHLRSLAYDHHHRSFTFRTLESLELIEEIDRPVEITHSMCRAYWAIAAECTPQSVPGDKNGAVGRGDLEDLVNRLLTARAGNLKEADTAAGLLSSNLVHWRACLLRMMPDPEVLNQFVRQTTKEKAVELLGLYLTEATQEMGRPFLRVLSEKAGKAEFDGLGISLDAGAAVLRASKDGADAGVSGGMLSPERIAPTSILETAHKPVDASAFDLSTAAEPEGECQVREKETGMPKENHIGDKDASGPHDQACTTKETTSAIHQGKRILPLMTWNPTAQTHQWGEDSDMTTPEEGPSEIKWSNLKKSVRRIPRKWSVEEEDTLREAIKRYGKGRWKLILNIYQATFEGRTKVDLKDKWRNMTAR